MLLAALIPESASNDWGLPRTHASQFLATLHRALVEEAAERLRRRDELMAATRALIVAEDSEARQPTPLAWGHLTQERRLTVADVREVEQRRRQGTVLQLESQGAAERGRAAASRGPNTMGVNPRS